MKNFLLVFEDLLNGHIHDSPDWEPASCQAEAPSKEALITELGLKEIKEGRGTSPVLVGWKNGRGDHLHL